MEKIVFWCKKNKWLIVIVLLGALLRFYHLSGESLWTDEMISLSHTTASSLTSSVITKELMPPGYFILLKGWISYFGTSEFSLRFISAFFDTLSIILVFYLGKIIFGEKFGEEAGLWAALIYALGILPLVYAQEARPYALFTFLVLFSTYLLSLLLRPRQGKKKLCSVLFYSITISLALYVNYTFFFVLFIHLLVLLNDISIEKKKALLGWWLGAILLSILCFMLYGFQVLYFQAQLRQPALQEGLALRGVPVFLSNLGIGFYVLVICVFLVSFILLFYLLARHYKHNKNYDENYENNKNNKDYKNNEKSNYAIFV